MSKAKRTKRYITEKTAEIFNKKGFNGTSMSDITTATGLTKGSIYGNFKNKEEVAIAAFNYNYQNLIKRFTIHLIQENTAIGRLHAFLKTYEALYEDIIHIGGCPILNNAVDSDDTNTILNALSSKAFYDWNKNLESIIKLGQSNGEVNNDIEAGFYSSLFVSTIEGGLVLAKSTGEKKYFDHVIKHLKTTIKNSLSINSDLE